MSERLMPMIRRNWNIFFIIQVSMLADFHPNPTSIMFKGKSIKNKTQRLCVHLWLFHLKVSSVPNFLFFWRESFEGAPLLLEGSGNPMKRVAPRTLGREKTNLCVSTHVCKIPQQPGRVPMGPPVRVRDLQSPGASPSLRSAANQPASARSVLCSGGWRLFRGAPLSMWNGSGTPNSCPIGCRTAVDVNDFGVFCLPQ